MLGATDSVVPAGVIKASSQRIGQHFNPMPNRCGCAALQMGDAADVGDFLLLSRAALHQESF